MTENTFDELLADLIDGGVAAGSAPAEVAAMLALANRCRRLSMPAPTPAAEARIRTRVLGSIGKDRASHGWLAGWFGGTAARPLRERLAAGGIVLLAVGGGAGAATGVTPAEFARSTGGLIQNIVVNLSPGDDGPSGNGAPTPAPDATVTATGTSTPGASSTAISTTATVSTPVPGGNANDPIASATPRPGQDTPESPATAPPSTPGTTTPPTGAAPSPSADPTAAGTPDDNGDDASKTPGSTRTPEPGDDDGGGGSNSGSGSGSSGSGSGSGSGSSGSGSTPGGSGSGGSGSSGSSGGGSDDGGTDT